MTVERDPFAPGWLVTVVVAVPLLGVADAVGPRPLAVLGFAANLTVLGVAGVARTARPRRAVRGGTGHRGPCPAHSRAGAGHHSRRGPPSPPGPPALGRLGRPGGRGRGSRSALPAGPPERTTQSAQVAGCAAGSWPWDLGGASLTAAGAVLAAAVALSVWTAGRQSYPVFSALSAMRAGGAERSVEIELTSEEAAPTRFIVAVAVGSARPDSITLRLAPGVTWRKTVPAPASASVTVVAYRGTRSRVPYREVHLAPRGTR